MSQEGEDKLYLAIVGYWRMESNDMNIIHGIISIIFDFYKFEEWSKEGSSRSIDHNHIQFHATNRSAYGMELISSGKHEWSIKSTFSSGLKCQWIGIASDFTALEDSNWGPFCMIWCNGCNAIQGYIESSAYFNGALVRVKPEDSWKSGDCITIKLDLDQQTISWYKNKDLAPVATYNDVPKASYKVAVLGCSNHSFEIMKEVSHY